MPGSGKFVLIRHGEYLTIYSNLKDVFVKVGDNVNTKQKIASVIFDPEETQSTFHFELWKGKTKQNPANWLYQTNR